MLCSCLPGTHIILCSGKGLNCSLRYLKKTESSWSRISIANCISGSTFALLLMWSRKVQTTQAQGPVPTEGSHGQAQPVCDETQELTGALESDDFPVNGCILCLPGHSQSEFLEENTKISPCPGHSLAARAFLRCVWFPSSKQPFENLPSLSLSPQSFYHLQYELHQRDIRHMESCSVFFTRAQRAPWYWLTQRGFRTSALEGLSAFGSCYRSASTVFLQASMQLLWFLGTGL